MDLVRVAVGGAGAPSPRSPASASCRDLAGWIGAVPAVQRVRTSVGAKLPRWWRAPDRLLSRHRVGARELVVSIRDRGNRVVGPGRAQGDVCVRPLDDRPSEGRSSDPISGAYTGGGVVYTPHRAGGADDQIAPGATDGTASTDWTDGLVQSPTGGPMCAQNQPIGLRWVSSSTNGTAGQGVWGGTPSRLAYFAFEITGID